MVLECAIPKMSLTNVPNPNVLDLPLAYNKNTNMNIKYENICQKCNSTCLIVILTCDHFMSRYNIHILTCSIIMLTCEIKKLNYVACQQNYVHMRDNKSNMLHVNIFKLHIYIIYLAFKGQKYATKYRTKNP